MSDPGTDPTQINEPVTTVFTGGPPTVPPAAGPPEVPPPDRGPWVIAAILAVIVALLVILLLVNDDDDDEDSVASTTSTTSSTTSTTAAPDTTAASTTAPSTTEAPPATLDPDDCEAAGANAQTPGLAAETVYEAWVLGDEACAGALMTEAARTELFTRDGTGASDTFQGCTEVEEPDPHADCAFTYEGGSTHYLMNFSPTDGWTVFDVTQVAD